MEVLWTPIPFVDEYRLDGPHLKGTKCGAPLGVGYAERSCGRAAFMGFDSIFLAWQRGAERFSIATFGFSQATRVIFPTMWFRG